MPAVTTGNQEVVYKIAGSEDGGAVLAFLNRYYSPRRTLEQWTWEYFNRDACTFLFTGWRGERVVATQGMLREDLVLDGTKLIAGKSETSLVAEELRGSGAFPDMYSRYLDYARKEGMDLVWGITTATKVWRDKLGFQLLGDSIHSCTLTIRPGRAMFSELRSDSPLKVKAWRGMRSLTSRPATRKIARYARDAPMSYLELQGQELAEELKGLYSGIERIEPVTLAMRESHIGWRITRNPMIGYRLTVGKAGGDRSWCLWGVDGENKACISDIWCKDEAGTDDLVREVLRKCLERKVTSLRFIGNTQHPILHRAHRILVGLGATGDERGSGFFVKWLKEPRGLPDWQRWRITGLWTEGYTY